MRRLGVWLVALSMLVLASAAPASAAATHSSEDFTYSGDTCGIQTDVHVVGRLVVVKDTFFEGNGMPAIVNIHDRFTYTSVETGRVASFDWFGKLTQAYVGREAGISNLLILQTFYGLEARVTMDNGGVVGIDAGRLTLITVWDETGSTELALDLVAVKGPHPLFLSDTAFCDAMVAALD